jgi:hypothetical protein
MKTIKYFLTICIGIFAITSCTKQLDDAYLNPNAPLAEDLKPSDLFPPLGYQMALNLQDDNRYIGLYSQVFGYRLTWAPGSTDAFAYFDKMGYRPGVDNSGAIWRMHYFNLGQNLNVMIDKAVAANQWDYAGAGYAIRAWSWLTTTDYHGEVVLKEAFNTQKTDFKYDPQDLVYDTVRKICRQAIESLDKPVSGGDFAAADQWLYGGDKNKWKKFVYGILARSFHHLTNKSSYNADSVIFYCDKAMQVPSEDLTYKFVGGIVNNQNNFYGQFRVNIANFRQSRMIAELMKGNTPTFPGVDDPRRWYMLTTAPDGVTMNGYLPVSGEGQYATAARPNNFWGHTATPTADTARFIFRNNADFPMMTSSEIQFMKSEAAFRKGNKALALSAYKNGISQHFDMLLEKYNVNIRPSTVMTTATRDAFLLNTAVVPASPASLTLSMIMQQKFIALWGYGVLETWTDMRRYHYTDTDADTGFPVYRSFTPVAIQDLFSDNASKMAYRVRPRYNSEYVWNLANLAAVGGDKTDYHTFEMWFSKP